MRRAVIIELEKIFRERYRRLLKDERYLRYKIFVVCGVRIVLRRVLRLCANGGFARVNPGKSFCERVISKRFVGIVRAGKRKRGSRRVSCLIDDDCFFVIRQDIVVVRHGYRISARVFELASLAVFCEYKVCGIAVVRCRGRGLSVVVNVTFRNSPFNFGSLFVYREFAGDESYLVIIACGNSRNGNFVFASIRACAAVNRFARKRFALYKPRNFVRKRRGFAVSYRDVFNLYCDRFLVYRKRNASFFFREGVVVNNLKVYLVRACVCIFGRIIKRAIVFGRAVRYRVVFAFFGLCDLNAVRLPVVRQRNVREIYCEGDLYKLNAHFVRNHVAIGVRNDKVGFVEIVCVICASDVLCYRDVSRDGIARNKPDFFQVFCLDLVCFPDRNGRRIIEFYRKRLCADVERSAGCGDCIVFVFRGFGVKLNACGIFADSCAHGIVGFKRV